MYPIYPERYPGVLFLAIACCTKYILNVNTCTGAENIEPFFVTC
jgi:hypothetical protein